MTSLDLGVDPSKAMPAIYGAKYACSAFLTLSALYVIEVFPSACRTTGLNVCLAVARLGSISAPLVFERLTTPQSHSRFFSLCALVLILAVAMVRATLQQERKNRPLEDSPRRRAKTWAPGDDLKAPSSLLSSEGAPGAS